MFTTEPSLASEPVPPPKPQWFIDNHYFAGRPPEGDLWLVVAEMIYTWRVMVCDDTTVYDFCCFQELRDAITCWAVWDGKGTPPGNWTRYKSTVS
jgi:hypothetical protein